MGEKGFARIWLLAVLAVVGSAFGYYLYSVSDSDPAKEQENVEVVAVEEVQAPPEKTAPLEETFEKKQVEPLSEQKEEPVFEKQTLPIIKGKIESDTPSVLDPAAPENQKDQYCKKMEEYVLDYLKYLDENVQPNPDGKKENSLEYFKRILENLEKRPPIPAGEGSSPTMMIANIYYFSRALDRKDIAFIKNIIGSDKDTLEINMDMIFRWLMSGDFCPDEEGLRPSFDMLYRYAGFFLNTTGGRAYMFRRSTDIRLLTTYYALLIIHKADRLGLNQYGIDILPYIKTAKQEIAVYPHLQFQEEYRNNLLRLENYYRKRR